MSFRHQLKLFSTAVIFLFCFSSLFISNCYAQRAGEIKSQPPLCFSLLLSDAKLKSNNKRDREPPFSLFIPLSFSSSCEGRRKEKEESFLGRWRRRREGLPLPSKRKRKEGKSVQGWLSLFFASSAVPGRRRKRHPNYNYHTNLPSLITIIMIK